LVYLSVVFGVTDPSGNLNQGCHHIHFSVILVGFAYDEDTSIFVKDVAPFETGGRIEVKQFYRMECRLNLELTQFFLILLLGILVALRANDSALFGSKTG
jgi:hypothetical protein